MLGGFVTCEERFAHKPDTADNVHTKNHVPQVEGKSQHGEATDGALQGNLHRMQEASTKTKMMDQREISHRKPGHHLEKKENLHSPIDDGKITQDFMVRKELRKHSTKDMPSQGDGTTNNEKHLQPKPKKDDGEKRQPVKPPRQRYSQAVDKVEMASVEENVKVIHQSHGTGGVISFAAHNQLIQSKVESSRTDLKTLLVHLRGANEDLKLELADRQKVDVSITYWKMELFWKLRIFVTKLSVARDLNSSDLILTVRILSLCQDEMTGFM